METLGFMSLNENSENEYFTEIATRAALEGITCYRFVPTNIHPVTQMVKGKTFDPNTNQWIYDQFHIPTVLYDRCFYGEDFHSKQCNSIVSWLKKREDIFFLGYGLPNKYELYNVLKQSPLYPYLPFTKRISHPSIVLAELLEHLKVVLKPVNGSQGIGIYYIELQEQSIYVKTYNRNQHIHKNFDDQKKFLSWINSLISKQSYLLQPYLELTNTQMEPFDIRILLQKDLNGNWVERGRGVRIGNREGILSNLSAGGTILHFEEWEKQLSLTQKEYFQSELNDILSKIPIVLEQAFLPLFELGIDIGIAKNGSIWILDINSKPGRKVILETNQKTKDALYKSPFSYGKTLGRSENTERKRFDAQTLSY